MSPETLIAFTFAAALLTVTPGLDTALVLRTAITEGPRAGLAAGLGIAFGCLAWGLAVAAGLVALLQASSAAFAALRWLGAAYLFWLGANLIIAPRRAFDLGAAQALRADWMQRGFLTNILNPKVGVFYFSFLPQFIPAHSNAALWAVILTAVHAGLGLLWFALIVAATRPAAKILQRPRIVAWLDRATGGLFMAFGLALAFGERR